MKRPAHERWGGSGRREEEEEEEEEEEGYDGDSYVISARKRNAHELITPNGVCSWGRQLCW